MSKTESKTTVESKEVLTLPPPVQQDTTSLQDSCVDAASEEETAKFEASSERPPEVEPQDADESFQAPVDQLRRKEFGTKRSGDGLWKIVLEGGGQLPAGLHGHFTSVEEAQIVIDKYNRS